MELLGLFDLDACELVETCAELLHAERPELLELGVQDQLVHQVQQLAFLLRNLLVLNLLSLKTVREHTQKKTKKKLCVRESCTRCRTMLECVLRLALSISWFLA